MDIGRKPITGCVGLGNVVVIIESEACYRIGEISQFSGALKFKVIDETAARISVKDGDVFIVLNNKIRIE